MPFLLWRVMSDWHNVFGRMWIVVLIIAMLTPIGVVGSVQAQSTPSITNVQPLEGVVFWEPSNGIYVPIPNATVYICGGGVGACNGTGVAIDADSQGIWYANITNNSYSSYYMTWNAPGLTAMAWNFSWTDLAKSGFTSYDDNGHYLCNIIDNYYTMVTSQCPSTLNGYIPYGSSGYAYEQPPIQLHPDPRPFVQETYEEFSSVTDAPITAYMGVNFSGQYDLNFQAVMNPSKAVPVAMTPPYISGYWFPVGYEYSAQFCATGYYCTNESFQTSYNTTDATAYPVYLYPTSKATPPAVSYIQGMVVGESFNGNSILAESPIGGANITLNYTQGMAPVLFANYTSFNVFTNGEQSANQVVNFTVNSECDGVGSLPCQLNQGPWNVAFTATFPGGGSPSPPGPAGHPDLAWFMDDTTNPSYYNYFVKLPNSPSIVTTNSAPIVLTMWFNENSSNPYTYHTSDAASVFGLYADWSSDQVGNLSYNTSTATYYNGAPFSVPLAVHPDRRAMADGTAFSGANITVLPYGGNPQNGPYGSEGGQNLIPNPTSGLLINSPVPYFIQYSLGPQMQNGSWRIITTGTTYWPTGSAAEDVPSILMGMGSYTNGPLPISYGTFTGADSYYYGSIGSTAWSNISGFNYTTPRSTGVLPSQIGHGVISYSMINGAGNGYQLHEWAQTELVVNLTSDYITGEGYLYPTNGVFGGARESMFNRSWAIPHTGPISLVTGSAQMTAITSVYAIPYVAHWPTVVAVTGTSEGYEPILGQTPYVASITTVSSTDGRFLISIPTTSPAYNHELFINITAPHYDGCGRVQDWPVFLAANPQNNSTTVDVMMSCVDYYNIHYTGSNTNGLAYFNGYALGQDAYSGSSAPTLSVFPDWRADNTFYIAKENVVTNYTSLTFNQLQTDAGGVANSGACKYGGSASACYFDPVTPMQYTNNPSACAVSICNPVQPTISVNVGVGTVPSWAVPKGSANGLEFDWSFGTASHTDNILTHNRVVVGLQIPISDMRTVSFSELPMANGHACTGQFHCWTTTNSTVATFSLLSPAGYAGMERRADAPIMPSYTPGMGLPCLNTAACTVMESLNSNPPTGVARIQAQGVPIIKFVGPLTFHGLRVHVGLVGDHEVILSLIGALANKNKAPQAELLYHGFGTGSYRVTLTNTTTGKQELTNDFTTSLQSHCISNGAKPGCGARERYVMVNWTDYAADANFTIYPASSMPPLTYVVSGRVTDSSGTPVASATVTLQGVSGSQVYFATAQTNNSGYYMIPLVVNGTYYLNGSASTSIYSPDHTTVTVSGANVTKNLVLIGGGLGPSNNFDFNSAFWETVAIVVVVSLALFGLFLFYERKHKKWPYRK